MSNETSFFARRRILISRLIIWPLAAVLLVTASAWDKRPPIDGLIFAMGCVLVGVASIGRLWCSLYICGHKTKNLVTAGPYSMTRNPLYFFSAVGAIGIGLASETFTVPIVLILLFAMAYPSVIRAEENRLREIHGDAFDAYVASTPRFFPRFSRYTEPEFLEVNLRKFRGALFDALAFVWLLSILELGEALREVGIIPTLLTLY
ncbi:MAG: isoprenylcysteine carboxylmethyltransferase family protein [bacterium]